VLAWPAALLSGLGAGILLSALYLLTAAAVLGAFAMAAAAAAGLLVRGWSAAELAPVAASLAALAAAWLFLGFGLAGF
jgi:hypothetical protein